MLEDCLRNRHEIIIALKFTTTMFINCCLYCFAFVAFPNMVIADDLPMDSRNKLHPIPDYGTIYKRIKRIVNGQEITPHSRPYLVYLTNGSQVYCGGSILDANTILTAAHCFDIGLSYVVVAGAHYATINMRTQQRSNVKAVYIHEQYNRNNYKNDIAILKLASPFNLGRPEVRSLSVNTNPSCPVTGSLCRVTGWGRTTECSTCSNVPREVNIRVISNSNCYRNTIYYSLIFDSSICAGSNICTNRMYADSCQGDSGGPIACVCDGEYKIAGIVSWGVGCGRFNCPGVYTRVSSYINWIDTTTRTSGSNFLQCSVKGSTIITIVIFVLQFCKEIY